MIKDALLSKCGDYRYWLTRKVQVNTMTCLFVMLNPSVADAFEDDPTIRRCLGFAKTWGFSGITVVNLYAFRSPTPAKLWTVDDPCGPENDYYLNSLISKHRHAVCAWGANAKPEAVQNFRLMAQALNAKLYCLGVTKKWQPRHPLYIKADQPLIRWL